MIRENDLPDGWKVVTLGDICNLVTDGTHDKTPLVSKEEGMPLVTSKDLAYNGICFDNVLYISKSQHNQIIKRSKPERGDILYSKIGTIGKPTIVDVNFEFSIKNVALFKLKKNIACDKYVRYYLSSDPVHNLLVKTAGGGNQKFIPLNKLKQIKIILPPLQTQQKIVAILEKVERLKEWRKEADELTDEFLKSTFLKMFGDPVFNPNKWKAVKLQEVAQIVSGVTKGRKLSGKNTVFVPYMRVANVQDGYLDLNEIKTIEVLPSDVDKFALKDGDVLLTEGGDRDKLGRGSVWHDEIPNCIHQNHIFRVRVNKECLSPTFLSMLIGSPYGKMYFLKSAKQTTGIASINSKQLKNFPAYIPPPELQQKFASIVQQVEQLREYQSQSRQHIDDLFNVLMQKAFKGELV